MPGYHGCLQRVNWVPWVSVNSELKKVDELDTSSQDSDAVGTSSCGMMSGNQ